MDDDLKQELLSAESAFFLSVQDGPAQWSSLSSRWTSLQNTLQDNLRSRCLRSETISLAKVVAARVAIVAEDFLAVYSDSKKLTANFMNTIDNTLTQSDQLFDLEEPTIAPPPPARANKSQQDETITPSWPSEESSPDDDTSPPPPIAGVKRRASSLDAMPKDSCENIAQRPHKRVR